MLFLVDLWGNLSKALNSHLIIISSYLPMLVGWRKLEKKRRREKKKKKQTKQTKIKQTNKKQKRKQRESQLPFIKIRTDSGLTLLPVTA